jgi:mono/diheme cytochrome c family protein
MLHRVAFALVFTALPASFAAAQGAPSAADLRAGHQLFTQSCAICHLKPQITSPRFGPQLSHQVVAGQEEGIRAFIQTGTDHMPGFRYELAPAQIDLIIAYLATVPDPAQRDLGAHDHTLAEYAAAGRAMPGRAIPNSAMPNQGDD